MGSEWTYCRLGDVATIQGGFAFKSRDFRESGVPVAKIRNVRNRDIDLSEADCVSEDIAKEHSHYYVREGDVLISMTGSGINAPASIVGRVARHSGNNGDFLINQRVGRFVVCDTEKTDLRYLYYFFSRSRIRNLLVSIATGSANQVNISAKQVESVELSLPPLREQQRIAQILGTLDDKIELNRRMNRTLEAIARAIFKSWFIDFDPVHARAEGREPIGMDPDTAALFPDSFKDSPLGKIPKGCEVAMLGDCAEILDQKRIPLNARERSERQGPYPYYGAAGIMDRVDDYLFDGVHLLVGEDGSVATEQGHPVLQYVWGRFWVNNHAHVLIGLSPISTEFLFLALNREYILPYVTGAVQPKLNQGNLKRVPLVLPPEPLLARFDVAVRCLFETNRHLVDEIGSLESTRDTLLPQLLTGQAWASKRGV